MTTGVVVQEVAEGESCYGVTRATTEGHHFFSEVFSNLGA